MWRQAAEDNVTSEGQREDFTSGGDRDAFCGECVFVCQRQGGDGFVLVSQSCLCFVCWVRKYDVCVCVSEYYWSKPRQIVSLSASVLLSSLTAFTSSSFLFSTKTSTPLKEQREIFPLPFEYLLLLPLSPLTSCTFHLSCGSPKPPPPHTSTTTHSTLPFASGLTAPP